MHYPKRERDQHLMMVLKNPKLDSLDQMMNMHLLEGVDQPLQATQRKDNPLVPG